jgi:hypothetical protein
MVYPQWPAGDAVGNVRVYNLLTLSLVAVQEAHDSEVLSLDYSPGFLVSGGLKADEHYPQAPATSHSGYVLSDFTSAYLYGYLFSSFAGQVCYLHFVVFCRRTRCYDSCI